MRRRDFIAALSSAAAGWPLVALAQQAPAAKIGILHGDHTPKAAARSDVLIKALADVRSSRADRWAEILSLC